MATCRPGVVGVSFLPRMLRAVVDMSGPADECLRSVSIRTMFRPTCSLAEVFADQDKVEHRARLPAKASEAPGQVRQELSWRRGRVDRTAWRRHRAGSAHCLDGGRCLVGDELGDGRRRAAGVGRWGQCCD